MPLPWECPGPGHHSTGPFTDAVRILQASGRVMAPALEKLTAQAEPDRGDYKQGDSHQAPGHSQGREDDLQLSPCTVLCEKRSSQKHSSPVLEPDAPERQTDPCFSSASALALRGPRPRPIPLPSCRSVTSLGGSCYHRPGSALTSGQKGFG